MSRNKEHEGGVPNGAAAEGGRLLGDAAEGGACVSDYLIS